MLLKNYTALIPLKSWPLTTELALPGKVWVRAIEEGLRPQMSFWNDYLSGQQIKSVGQVRFWLAHDFSDEPYNRTDAKREAMNLVRGAILAYQFVRPVGTYDTDPFVLLCERANDKLVPDSVDLDPPFHSTEWGRTAFTRTFDPAELSTVVEGVQSVVQNKLIRLQNPLNLLSLGLQQTNLHIRVFLWVAALDVLLMAGGNSEKFAKRLCSFLGSDTFVFPAIEYSGQPRYRVDDVVRDLFELRSVIAHGNEIPTRFRESVGFRDCSGGLIHDYRADYQRRQLLHQCALFLLCAVLKRVFVSKSVPEVSQPKKWRTYLENCGPAPP